MRSSLFGTALISIDMHRPAPISAKFVTVMNGLRISSQRSFAVCGMFARTAASSPPYTRSSFSSSIGRYSRMMCFIGSFALFGNR